MPRAGASPRPPEHVRNTSKTTKSGKKSGAARGLPRQPGRPRPPGRPPLTTSVERCPEASLPRRGLRGPSPVGVPLDGGLTGGRCPEATRHPGPAPLWWSFLRSLWRPPRLAHGGPGAISFPVSRAPRVPSPVGRHHNRISRNLGEEGLPSADRNNKATLLLTGPFRATKSYAKDSSPRASKLQFANHHRDTSRPVGRPPAKTLSRSLFLSV